MKLGPDESEFTDWMISYLPVDPRGCLLVGVAHDLISKV